MAKSKFTRYKYAKLPVGWRHCKAALKLGPRLVSGHEFTRAETRLPIFREIKPAAKPRPETQGRRASLILRRISSTRGCPRSLAFGDRGGEPSPR